MTDTNDDARVDNPGIIKIIGIGQSLRGDDAAGLEAVKLWGETRQSKVNQPTIQVELLELPGVGLLDHLVGVRMAILVDAVRSSNLAKPGTLYIITESQLEAFTGGSGSAHGWGVAETLTLGRKLMPSSLPAKLFLVGIEAGQLDLGEKLSPEVEAALPEVTRLIEQLIGEQSAQG